MGWDAAYRRGKNTLATLMLEILHRDKKKPLHASWMPQIFWNILKRSSSAGNSERKHKKWRRRAARLFQAASSWHVYIFNIAYWFTHRLVENLRPVREGLNSHSFPVVSILPPVLFDPQPAAQIYSSSRVIFNTWLFFFKQRRVSDLSCAKNIQHAHNIYRFLQVHLADF